jgi:hypothetical protein
VKDCEGLESVNARLGFKRVDPQMVASTKYYLPLIVFVGCGSILLAGHPDFSTFAFRALLNAPIIVIACFFLTVAEVRVSDGFLEYHRLIGWTRVRYSQIAECEKSWFPTLGRLTLIRSDKSPSKLYFISGMLVHAEPRRIELTTYITNRLSGEPPSEGDVNVDSNSNRQKSRQLCLITGLLGVLGSLVLALVSHRSYASPDFAGFPWAIALASAVFWKVTSWPWGLITCAALIAEVVRLRYEEKAWMVSFVAGSLLGSILVEAVRHAAL